MPWTRGTTYSKKCPVIRQDPFDQIVTAVEEQSTSFEPLTSSQGKKRSKSKDRKGNKNKNNVDSNQKTEQERRREEPSIQLFNMDDDYKPKKRSARTRTNKAKQTAGAVSKSPKENAKDEKDLSEVSETNKSSLGLVIVPQTAETSGTNLGEAETVPQMESEEDDILKVKCGKTNLSEILDNSPGEIIDTGPAMELDEEEERGQEDTKEDNMLPEEEENVQVNSKEESKTCSDQLGELPSIEIPRKNKVSYRQDEVGSLSSSLLIPVFTSPVCKSQESPEAMEWEIVSSPSPSAMDSLTSSYTYTYVSTYGKSKSTSRSSRTSSTSTRRSSPRLRVRKLEPYLNSTCQAGKDNIGSLQFPSEISLIPAGRESQCSKSDVNGNRPKSSLEPRALSSKEILVSPKCSTKLFSGESECVVSTEITPITGLKKSGKSSSVGIPVSAPVIAEESFKNKVSTPTEKYFNINLTLSPIQPTGSDESSGLHIHESREVNSSEILVPSFMEPTILESQRTPLEPILVYPVTSCTSQTRQRKLSVSNSSKMLLPESLLENQREWAHPVDTPKENLAKGKTYEENQHLSFQDSNTNKQNSGNQGRGAEETEVRRSCVQAAISSSEKGISKSSRALSKTGEPATSEKSPNVLSGSGPTQCSDGDSQSTSSPASRRRSAKKRVSFGNTVLIPEAPVADSDAQMEPPSPKETKNSIVQHNNELQRISCETNRKTETPSRKRKKNVQGSAASKSIGHEVSADIKVPHSKRRQSDKKGRNSEAASESTPSQLSQKTKQKKIRTVTAQPKSDKAKRIIHNENSGERANASKRKRFTEKKIHSDSGIDSKSLWRGKEIFSYDGIPEEKRWGYKMVNNKVVMLPICPLNLLSLKLRQKMEWTKCQEAV